MSQEQILQTLLQTLERQDRMIQILNHTQELQMQFQQSRSQETKSSQKY